MNVGGENSILRYTGVKIKDASDLLLLPFEYITTEGKVEYDKPDSEHLFYFHVLYTIFHE